MRWLAGGEMRYYRAAVKLADAMIARFYDQAEEVFRCRRARRETPLGALAARRKPLQDSPTPAGNPTAASALLRLEALSGRKEYREIAEDTLASFAGIVEHFGLYAGSYGLALERLLLDPVQVVVVGSGAEAERLEARAGRFAVNKTVMRIAPERLVPGGIPEALAETLLQVPKPVGAEAGPSLRNRSCLPRSRAPKNSLALCADSANQTQTRPSIARDFCISIVTSASPSDSACAINIRSNGSL